MSHKLGTQSLQKGWVPEPTYWNSLFLLSSRVTQSVLKAAVSREGQQVFCLIMLSNTSYSVIYLSLKKKVRNKKAPFRCLCRPVLESCDITFHGFFFLALKWCWEHLIPAQDPEETKLRWAFLHLPVQDSLHKINLPTSVPSKALHILPAPPPTLPLHIPCISTVLLFPLLRVLPVLTHCSHLPAPLLPFIFLLGWCTVCDHERVFCKNHSTEHVLGWGIG